MLKKKNENEKRIDKLVYFFLPDKVKIWRNKVKIVRNFFCEINIQFLL